jgi:hypothetical protein
MCASREGSTRRIQRWTCFLCAPWPRFAVLEGCKVTGVFRPLQGVTRQTRELQAVIAGKRRHWPLAAADRHIKVRSVRTIGLGATP